MIVFAVKAALFPVQFWLPGHLRERARPGRRALRDHDQGRRLRDPAHAHHGLRPRRGRDRRAGGKLALSRPRSSPSPSVHSACSARAGCCRWWRSRRSGRWARSWSPSRPSRRSATAARSTTCRSLDLRRRGLFLVADLVVTRRGADTLVAAPATAQNGLFAALFFGAAIAMAGMPPLSGFLGKLLVLDSLRAPGAVRLGVERDPRGSLLTIVGFARAGSTLFWKSTAIAVPRRPETAAAGPRRPRGPGPAEIAPAMAALATFSRRSPPSPGRSRPISRPLPRSCSTARVMSRPCSAGRGGLRHAQAFIPHPLLSLTLTLVWLAWSTPSPSATCFWARSSGFGARSSPRPTGPTGPRLRGP